jgi:5,10-methylenetetrahydrofolate reductase
MKLSNKISSFDGNFVSFEFFPPKTDDGKRNLIARIQRMSKMTPLYVDGKTYEFYIRSFLLSSNPSSIGHMPIYN